MIQDKKSGVRSQKSGEKGFTLIETIITLVVLSIAAVGVISVFTVGIKGSSNPLVVEQAVQLAQGEMDQVMGERAASGVGGINAACVTPMLTGFNCSRTLCYVSSGNLNDISACGTATSYRHITVTVDNALIGSVSVDTIVANY